MAVANLSALLKQNADAYKAPPVLPEGIYFALIQKWEGVKSDKKGTPGIQFIGTYTHAHEDVGDLVDEAGEPIDITKRPFYHTIYASEGGTNFHRVVEFLKDLGLNTAGRPLDQLLEETRGMPVQVDLAQVPSLDGTRLVNNVRGVSAVAE